MDVSYTTTTRTSYSVSLPLYTIMESMMSHIGFVKCPPYELEVPLTNAGGAD